MWCVLIYLSKYSEITEFEDWSNFFQFPFVKMLWSSTWNISLPAVMWVRSSSSEVNTFKAKAEAELWLNKLYCKFHMKMFCISSMSVCIMYNPENHIPKIYPGQVIIPKIMTETWGKAYTQSRDVSRQNIWFVSCARTHTDGHTIVWWQNWKPLFIFKV